MMTCEKCRAALLDRQYGLLDAAEATALDTHVAACPACKAEQTRVERFGRLLSAAARTDFPDVRFVAPPTNARTPAGYTTNGARGRSVWALTAWAVAAALLLGIGIPAGTHVATASRQQSEFAAAIEKKDSLETQRRELTRKHAEEITATQLAWKDAQNRTREAQTKYVAQLGKAQSELQAKQFSFTVTGPKAIPAGAPAEYLIQTRDFAGRAAPVTLNYKVRDEAKKDVTAATSVATSGDFTVKLPADLPLKPNTNLYLDVSASRADGAKAELREQISLTAPVYASHLTTDKPLYQPGEMVRFRSLTLDKASLKPAEEPLNIQFVVRDALGAETPIVAGGNQLSLADGRPDLGPDGKPIRGVGAGEWKIPPEAKGGEYTLAVKETNGRFPEERRKFLVNQYRPAKLNKELEWARKSFGPGDEVVANCKVTNASGPVANKPVSAEAFVDGKRITVPPIPATSADGTVAVRFKLPPQIEKGEGSLSIVFTDGANLDPLSKPIPIALKKLSVEFYAEGGELVAGMPNRVYFQARTTLGKPADLKGRIVDGTGRVAATTETLGDEVEPGINQGMGRFEFKPEIGQTYRLKIDQPVETEGEYKLPDVKSEGVILTVVSEVSGDPDPIRVRVASPSVGRTLLVGAYTRGRLLDHKRVTVAANQSAEVELKPEAGIGGVTRVTVFEEIGEPGTSVTGATHKTLQPRAERLVYRKPAAILKLTAEPDKSRYVPGERTTLSLKAANEKGEPVPAIAMVGVVNKSVVTMADEKTFRTMPTHFLLTSEVRRPEDLEHADVLLGSHPKAAIALDLLLGTQGWRRFAEQHVPPAKDQRADDTLLAIQVTSPQVTVSSFQLAEQKVRSEVEPFFYKAQGDLAASSVHMQVLLGDADYGETNRRLSAELAEARSAAQSAGANLATTLEWRQRTLRWLLPTACGLSLIVAIGALAIGFWRGFQRYVAVSGALGLVAATAALLAVNVGEPRDAGIQTALGRQLTEREMLVNANMMIGVNKNLADQLWEDGGADHDRLFDWGMMNPPQEAPEGNKDLFAMPQGLGFGGGMIHAPLAAAAPQNQAVRAALGAEMAPPSPAGAVQPPPLMQPPAAGALADKPGDVPGLGKNRGVDQNGLAGLGMAKDAAEVFRRGEADAKKPAVKEQIQLQLGEREKNVDKAEKALDGLERKGVEKPMAAAAPQAPGMGNGMGGFAGEPLGGGVGGGRGGRGGPGPDAMAKRRLAGIDRAQQVPPTFVVREFAHQHVTNLAADRTDFAETVFWHPVLVLPKDGAKVSFDLSDEVTRYQVLVAAHTLDGRIGATEGTIEARKPFSIEPKLPIEITAGDRIDVPVALANDTDSPRTVTVTAESKGLTLTHGSLQEKLTLAPQQSLRRVMSFQPTIVEGTAELRLTGKSEPAGNDAVVRTIPVVPEGFPVVGTFSDVLEGVAHQEIVLPETWVKGTLKCQVNVYPSTLAELQKGLEGLLREPGGCFEQTSTTNYPNALVLQYLKESDQANPAAMKQAKAMLERGYAKLTAFEVPAANKREGFEWFGSAPAHEALTAYGLMQFRDMATVTDVDPQMLQRTRDFLLARRDGKGGFTRNPLALDSFGRAPADVTNAYIIWALTESGKDDDVTKEITLLAEQAKSADDPYFLALVANILLNRDRGDEAGVILRKLANKLTKDGYLDGAKTSITGSEGRTLQIETTALAVLGWLKANRPAEFTPAVRSAVAWIGKQRGGYGGFGSTQSTILALKALIAYTKANKKTAAAGELSLGIGERVISKLAFAAGAQEALTVALPDPEHQLKPGKNAVRVDMTGKNTMPYTLTWSYQTLQPPSAEGCAVRLTTSLDRPKIAEGDAVHLNVKLENVSHKGQGMAVAILGLPAGLKLPDDFAQLKDLARLRENGTKPGQIGAFEVRGRELVLYWRDLAPDANIELSLDVRALVPGDYHGPASRAYLYYNPDAKCWTTPLAATIAAKE